MKIIDLLKPEAIDLKARADGKTAAIDRMISLMAQAGVVSDLAAYRDGVILREKEGTTGIGEGVAIPHCKSRVVTNPALAAAVFQEGVAYESLDGQPVKLIFLIAAPNTEDNVYLDVLSRLSTLLADADFTKRLIASEDVSEFLSLIDAAENNKFLGIKRKDCGDYRVLAVTACPTGIAHTYMAAEAIANAAKDRGISCKVETDGSGGAKNRLTASEIASAECIIVAADKKVEMARFDGKPVISVKVADGIYKAGELLKRAVSGNVPAYRSGEESKIDPEDASGGDGIFRQIYKHLMNGVSHMLPFVVGGGILIALSFLFDAGNSGATLGQGNRFSKFLNIVGNGAFAFILPVLAGFIAYSIADRPGLAVGFVGGFLANMTDAHAYTGTSFMQTGSSAGFLGAIIAGFAAGYLVILLKKACAKFPQSLDGIKPTLIYPFFGILILGALMYFCVNAPFALLNVAMNRALTAIGTEYMVILGLMLGIMMSIDMGGPINKAAYVFGIAMIQSGNDAVMAPVMAAGMVPPLAIAIATTLFPQKFTKRERQDGKVNYIMGISFITEGAIPFAASDPLRVILSSAIGSGIAGAICAAFGCTLMAPHGGIFVLPIIGHWYWFLLAVAVGSIVSAVIMGIWKKNAKDPELGKFKGLLGRPDHKKIKSTEVK